MTAVATPQPTTPTEETTSKSRAKVFARSGSLGKFLEVQAQATLLSEKEDGTLRAKVTPTQLEIMFTFGELDPDGRQHESHYSCLNLARFTSDRLQINASWEGITVNEVSF